MSICCLSTTVSANRPHKFLKVFNEAWNLLDKWQLLAQASNVVSVSTWFGLTSIEQIRLKYDVDNADILLHASVSVSSKSENVGGRCKSLD